MAETRTAAEKKAEAAAKATKGAEELLDTVSKEKAELEARVADLEAAASSAQATIDELTAELKAAKVAAEANPSTMSSSTQSMTVVSEKKLKINIRDTPSGTVLKAVAPGTVLEVAGEETDGWIPVKIPGFVMAEFLN